MRVSSVVRVAEPFGSGARNGVIGCAWARPPWREPVGAPGPEPSRRPPGSVGIRRLIEDPVQGGVAAFTSGLLRTQRHPARAMHPSFASRCVRALAGDHACGRRRPPVRTRPSGLCKHPGWPLVEIGSETTIPLDVLRAVRAFVTQRRT